MFLIVLSLAFAQALSRAAVSTETAQQPMLVPSSSSSSSRVAQGIMDGREGREAICWICAGVVRSSPRITMLMISESDILMGWLMTMRISTQRVWVIADLWYTS